MNIEKCGDFVNLIIKNMKSFGVKVKKNLIKKVKKRTIEKADITGEKYAQVNIDEVLQNIIICESSLDANINLEAIDNLMRLYAMAIQYFTAMNNPVYLTYVQK